jgi:23S rRNA (cytidine1920-2'-O)/16S rRNA (cytidine1409-2'-O)-methyltransferase
MRIVRGKSKAQISDGGKGVSRAAGKLAGAVREFGVDFRGKLVLDIGSSTGGWTEYALRAGAAKVVAVEKGTRQMNPLVAGDPRVELHEKTDIFQFHLTEVPEIILADVSFLSLTNILEYARMEIIGQQTVGLLALLKPQFEVRAAYMADFVAKSAGMQGANDLLEGGVVKHDRSRRESMRGFEGWVREHGYVILGKRDSDVVGRYGNRERMYYLGVDQGKMR